MIWIVILVLVMVAMACSIIYLTNRIGKIGFVRKISRENKKINKLFSIVLLAMIGCHCVWNSGSPVGYLPLIVWIIIFYYAKRGVQEINVFKKELV